MTDQDLEIIRLNGEIQLIQQLTDYFARSQDFWRCKYLKEHPELDNWNFVDDIENEL